MSVQYTGWNLRYLLHPFNLNAELLEAGGFALLESDYLSLLEQ